MMQSTWLGPRSFEQRDHDTSDRNSRPHSPQLSDEKPWVLRKASVEHVGASLFGAWVALLCGIHCGSCCGSGCMQGQHGIRSFDLDKHGRFLPSRQASLC